jgi:hypothetical protein
VSEGVPEGVVVGADGAVGAGGAVGALEGDGVRVGLGVGAVGGVGAEGGVGSDGAVGAGGAVGAEGALGGVGAEGASKARAYEVVLPKSKVTVIKTVNTFLNLFINFSVSNILFFYLPLLFLLILYPLPL